MNDQTRPDTRPIPVADGWAGAEMRVFTVSNLITTDQRTDRRMDQWTDKASYRVACPQLKIIGEPKHHFYLLITLVGRLVGQWVGWLGVHEHEIWRVKG